jgi:hypothetical protein
MQNFLEDIAEENDEAKFIDPLALPILSVALWGSFSGKI